MKKNKLKFKIVENDEFLYLELNNGMDIGYMKPLQKPKKDIIKEFKDRVKKYDGILEE